MDFLYSVWSIFRDNILIRPEYFISLIVLIGYLLLKKPLYETYAGTLKCIVGILIWNVGASGLVNTFRPILSGLNERFALKATVIDPYFGMTAAMNALGTLASWVMLTLLFGFLWNLVLILFRKVTKIRTLFLTGHIMLQQSATATLIVFVAIPELANVWGALATGILVGTYWAVFSNLTVESTNKLTENAGFAVGHQQMFGIWLTDKIAHKLGDKEKSLDNIKLPRFLQIFNDNVVTTGTLMLVFFGIIMVILGEPYLRHMDPANFPATLAFPSYIIGRALHFAVYLFILMRGIAMFVAELTTAFQGISEKVLPGTFPAVDCATIYGFGSQNAPVFGFLCGIIGQFIAIAGLFIFHSPIMVITGFVPVFFDNATVAVYADRFGGVRAAAIISFFSGVIQVLGGGFAAWYFATSQYGGWQGSFDWDTIWPAFGVILDYIKIPGVIILVLLMLVIPQVQYFRNKAGYYGQETE